MAPNIFTHNQTSKRDHFAFHYGPGCVLPQKVIRSRSKRSVENSYQIPQGEDQTRSDKRQICTRDEFVSRYGSFCLQRVIWSPSKRSIGNWYQIPQREDQISLSNRQRWRRDDFVSYDLRRCPLPPMDMPMLLKHRRMMSLFLLLDCQLGKPFAQDEDQIPQREDQVPQGENQSAPGHYPGRRSAQTGFIKTSLKRVGRQVDENYKKHRDSSQRKQDWLIGGIVQPIEVAAEDVTRTGEESTRPRRTCGCCSVSRWKRGPGRSKCWKQSGFANLWKRYRWSGSDDSTSGIRSNMTIDVPCLATGDGPPTAGQMPGIPSDMLRSCGHKPKASNLIFCSRSPTDKKRTLVAARGGSNEYRHRFKKNGKRKSEDVIKAFIRDDFAARHTSGYDHLGFSTDDEYPGDTHYRCVPSQSSCHTRVTSLDLVGAKGGGQVARNFTVPYESHIGAMLGSQFRILAFLRSEESYDIYAVKDVFHGQDCLAKAYTIRGTERADREPRRNNLKWNNKKASLLASIDQNEREWRVFSHLDFGRNKEVSLDPLAWCREQDYQTHFPAIDGRCEPSQGQYQKFPKSYASCFQASKESTQGRPTTKAQRVRDRQRRKRQKCRAVKATARIQGKNALLEGKDESVERACSSAKPNEVLKKLVPQRESLELATPLSDIRVTSSNDVESGGQESRHVTAAKQADSEFQKFLCRFPPREFYPPSLTSQDFLGFFTP